MILILLGFFSVRTFAQKPSPKDILQYINNYRRSKGLPALEMDKYMNKIAEGHSKDMADGSVPFSHDGFDERIEKIDQKLGQSLRSAENVAYGNLTAESVVKGWINSAGHRRNIRGKYTLTGIGVAKGQDGVYYFTQIFIGK